MPIRNSLRLTLALVLCSLLTLPAMKTAAQDSGSVLDSTTRARLAAIPLSAGDLPDGYVLQRESFLTVDELSDLFDGNISAAEFTDTGFVGMYASIYQSESGDAHVTTYVSQWNDADAADAGIRLLEDEGLTNPGVEVTDSSLDAGDGPAEITEFSVEDTKTLDATFLVGPYILGVTSEGPADAVIDLDGMTSLATALEARARAVNDGGAPDGIDLSLATSSIDVEAAGTEVQAGFLSSDEAEKLYGLSGSSLGNLQSSWVSLVAIGDDSSAPYVVIGKTKFADAGTAGRVLEQAADLVPYTVTLERDDEFAADGTDAARGYRYVSPVTQTSTEPDSYRALAQVGDTIVIVDIQAAGSVDAAKSTATDLLTAQLACTADSCETPTISLGG